jgi:hypothetical protein
MFYVAMGIVIAAPIPLAGVNDTRVMKRALKRFFAVQAITLGLITFCGGIFWEGTSPLWLIIFALTISIITSVKTFFQGTREVSEQSAVKESCSLRQ